MNSKVIGINIKKYRKAAGLTQEKLAELLDISTVHMSHMECGHVSMSIELLLKLCGILNVSPNHILNGAYKLPPTSPDSILDDLPDDTKLLAFKIVELLRVHGQAKD